MFENRIKSILGNEYESFEKALENEPVKAIRINSLKSNSRDYSSAAGRLSVATEILKRSESNVVENIGWEPLGFSYQGGAPGKHPYHEAGVYYIQEPSAMSPVSYLDPKPGEKILDLCAAPGGKSTQIASRMNGEGILVTNEIDRKRAQILSLNIERCGIRNAVVTNMKPEQLSEVFEGYFDKILVDAPCSGEGMFRKNDEAVSNWSLDNVRLCADRQTKILNEAVKMLTPGGKLVYSTCTFAPEEDELQTARLLTMGLKGVEIKLYDGMVPGDFNNLVKVSDIENDEIPSDSKVDISDSPEDAFKFDQEIINEIPQCTARLWPHKVSGEGHFLAVFEKAGDVALNSGLYGINGRVKALKEDEAEAFRAFADSSLKGVVFAKDTTSSEGINSKSDKKAKSKKGSKSILRLEGTLSGTPFMFGDQLYLAPAGMPGINGLSVMRPGLHLGTIKKDRFEPSHSLALALSCEEAVHSYDLASDSPEAMKFIGGESLRVTGQDNGWYLITTDGYSLGWAKYTGETFKNHYPKGLRIYT